MCGQLSVQCWYDSVSSLSHTHEQTSDPILSKNFLNSFRQLLKQVVMQHSGKRVPFFNGVVSRQDTSPLCCFLNEIQGLFESSFCIVSGSFLLNQQIGSHQ